MASKKGKLSPKNAQTSTVAATEHRTLRPRKTSEASEGISRKVAKNSKTPTKKTVGKTAGKKALASQKAKHKTSQKKMPAAELEEEEEGEEAGNEMEEDDVGDDEVDTAEFVDLEDATSVAEDKRERIVRIFKPKFHKFAPVGIPNSSDSDRSSNTPRSDSRTEDWGLHGSDVEGKAYDNEEPAPPVPRVTKRKHSPHFTSDDDPTGTPVAARPKDPNLSGNPTRAGVGKVLKPKSSLRDTKAIRVARSEKPVIVVQSSGDESKHSPEPRKQVKTSPVTSGDGTKPDIANRDPLFANIYKEASKELRYQLFFIDPFPNAVKQDALPRQLYNYGINATLESDTFKEAEVRAATKSFDGQWYASFNHMVSGIRSSMKNCVIGQVNLHFNKSSRSQKQQLLSKNRYWYEITETGDADLKRPFMNRAIIGTLKAHFFSGRKPLHLLFPDEFKQNLPTAEGGKGPEIPPALTAFAATFVHAALSSELNYKWKWEYDRFGTVYKTHLAHLKKIEQDNPAGYHSVLNRLYTECTGIPNSAHEPSEIDTETDVMNIPLDW